MHGDSIPSGGRSPGTVSRPSSSKRRWEVVLLAALLFLAASAGSGALTTRAGSAGGSSPAFERPAVLVDDGLSLLARAPLVPVADDASDFEVAGSTLIPDAPATTLSVVITLELSNQSELNAFLTDLSDPSSPVFHHYLTAAQFDLRFAPSAAAYLLATQYFDSFPVTDLTTLPDRVSISFDAPSSVLDEMFHTDIEGFSKNGVQYYAPSVLPELPAPLVASIAQVSGLGTYASHSIHTDLEVGPLLTGPFASGSPHPSVSTAAYLSPATVDGIQFEYAPDFQVAYDEQSLFSQYGFPTNATVATILWAGAYDQASGSAACSSLTIGQDVGPFDPADVYDFYNETLPAGQPHAQLTPVPLDGAALPGASASCDTTGAVFENTLDLEMVGSSAPGARVYNVYGPAATGADVDSAFAEILSPSSSLPTSVQDGLRNVTVISNSWGGSDGNDSSWYESLEQAQARGISVLASSGDSGDSSSSSKYSGTQVEFPSSMAYDSFGVVAVGGTTITLDPTAGANFLHISNQVVWYESAAYTGPGGPYGSTGGVSAVFPEPSWQKDTEAGTVIGGTGRGVPDLAAVANDTLVTITVDGVQYKATNATHGGEFYYVSGTSIASPLDAGLVATIDHALLATNNSVLGFLDPTLYQVANTMYTALPAENPEGVGAYANPGYTASLPTLPFYDITSGANAVYHALRAYDLVTGWGSLDAYNYTMYVLALPSTPVAGHLSGVRDWFNLTALRVTSTFPSGGTNTAYNASIQQNFFLANSLGAPVYWVQNVVYIDGVPGDWQMTFTGWIIFPFFGLYPGLVVYEYDWPATSLLPSFPVSMELTTQLVSPNGLGAEVDYSFGVQGAATLALPVPGASYIIGALNYTYSWQGVSYTNGPFAGDGAVGGLAPQLGLVGGPSGGIGNFLPPTAGNVSVWLEAVGVAAFSPAGTQTFGASADQTGEEAGNLSYTRTGSSSWDLAPLTGSTTQGIVAYEATQYVVQFAETGLPAGTSWSVTTDGFTQSSTGSSLELSLPNGTYSFTVSSANPAWSASFTPTFSVAGRSLTIPVTFTEATYAVTWQESGLPSGLTWSVTFNGTLRSLTTDGGTDSLSFPVEPNGTYPYAIGEVAGWMQTSLPPSGTERVDGIALTVALSYTQAVYPITWTEDGLPAGLTWSVTFDSVEQSLTTDGGPDSLSFASEPNGSYPYLLASVAGWYQQTIPASGTEAVDGGGLVVSVTYSPSLYPVTFNESGLPAGVEWYVNVTGEPSLSGLTTASGGSSLSESLPNGTYTMVVASADKRWAPTYASQFTVAGAPGSVSILFSILAYPVSFVETGLPSGLTWTVSFNGTLESLTTNGGADQLSFAEEPNGSYPYDVAVLPGWQQSTIPYSGSESVQGGPLVVALAYTVAEYGVTFTESGLASGTSWSVTLNSVTERSTTSTIEFSEPNGAYSYSVGAVTGYTLAPPSSGVVTVANASQNITAVFSSLPVPAYTVTFTETGLPAGTNWSVTFGTAVESSTTPTIVFHVADGTYAYTPGAEAGYHAASSQPNPLLVSGGDVAVTVTYSSSAPSEPWSGLSAFDWALLAAVFVALLLALLVLLGRRRRRDPVPPPWQE